MSYQKTIFKSILILNIFRGQSLSHTQKHLRTGANAAARRESKQQDVFLSCAGLVSPRVHADAAPKDATVIPATQFLLPSDYSEYDETVRCGG